MRRAMIMLGCMVLLISLCLPMCVAEGRLMNYRDWLEMLYKESGSPGTQEKVQLDALFHNIVRDGLMEEGIEFPREWPSKWLAGAIPEYSGTGWMYDVYIQRPPMSYAAKDIVHMAITMYGYLPEEVDAYISGLPLAGFEEVENEPLVRKRIMGELIESARSFRCGDCTLILFWGVGNGDEIVQDQPFVQFIVNFGRDPYVQDLFPTAGTELMNIEQWDALTGEFKGEPPKTDEVVLSEMDDGLQYAMILYPSQWPKGFFGDLIPEYVFPATLYYMQYTAPKENPLPEKALAIGLSITNFRSEHLEAYTRELVDFGYHEVAPEDYTQEDALLVGDANQCRVFALPSLRVYLATSQVEGFEPVLDIFMRFHGRNLED